MILKAVFERFAQKTPITVMTRALLEYALGTDALNALFDQHARQQYAHKLLFSSLVDLMALVVCRMQPSPCAAYELMKEDLRTSLSAVYDKLNGIEDNVTASLVRHVGCRLGSVIVKLDGQLPPLVPGYRTKIIDGKHLNATEHRLAVLRDVKAAPLPGQALVVLDPSLMLAIDMFPCQDGWAQERSLFSQVLESVTKKDLWIADRNFCTVGFLCGILLRQGFFCIRQHENFPVASSSEFQSCGRCRTGEVFEQAVTFRGEDGTSTTIRRIVVRLDKLTTDGDTEIGILTNVPAHDADAVKVAELYLERWTIERLFQTLTETLDGERPSLGYPAAALFAYAIALVSYNVAATLRATLRATFGHERVEAEVSWYYVANDLRFNYGGMDVALDEEIWAPFHTMSAGELAVKLKDYAINVQLSSFKRHRRGPKRPQPPRTKYADMPHVSTARLLALRRV
ncbi:MAG: transposase [Candidatus Eremiobacteraeota bacterium]|nr:transposase [Candidatus Eremiobacteraeota bacterium]